MSNSNLDLYNDTDSDNQPEYNQNQDQTDHGPNQLPINPTIHRSQTNHQPPARYSNLHAHTDPTENSPTYKMAMNLSDRNSWISAMQIEIATFIDLKCFHPDP